MKVTKGRKLLATGCAILALGVAGAGCTTTGNDAGVKDRAHGKRNVYDMPDGYPNISTVCIRGVLVMDTSGDAAPIPVTGVDPYYCKGLDGTSPRPNR